MNKKTVMISSGALGLILSISACSTKTYAYQVSGQVLEQYVDYDCPGEDIALGAVSFVAGGTKPGGGSSGKKATTTDTDTGGEAAAAAPQKKDPTKTPTKTPTKSPATSGSGAKSATPTPTVVKVSNKGVKLSEKPEKPEKLKGLVVPKPKYKVKPKGCEAEYEIFVLSGDTLYEQDVRKVDFDKCGRASIPKGQINRLFPLCTTGK